MNFSISSCGSANWCIAVTSSISIGIRVLPARSSGRIEIQPFRALVSLSLTRAYVHRNLYRSDTRATQARSSPLLPSQRENRHLWRAPEPRLELEADAARHVHPRVLHAKVPVNELLVPHRQHERAYDWHVDLPRVRMPGQHPLRPVSRQREDRVGIMGQRDHRLTIAVHRLKRLIRVKLPRPEVLQPDQPDPAPAVLD